MQKILFFLILFAYSTGAYSQLAEQTRLLRFPNASQAHITFTYGGNIYIAPLAGGLATKLTTSSGIEQISRFSPDGNTLAFIGNYDGNPEIYTMEINGSAPKRITYSMDMPNMPERQGPDKIIMQWTKDGKQIIYRSRKDAWNVLTGKLYKTNADGSEVPQELKLPKAGYASLNNDETKIAYNRIFREFRTWKRYRGGQADDIWIYDFNTKELTNITNNPAQDIIPMWHGDKIYYASDRDSIMNIFCYNTITKETRKITNFDNYDVKFPSLGSSHIAFENGGYIYTLELETEKLTQLKIKVIDDEPASRPELKDIASNIKQFDIAPDGNRGLFSARGEVFIVPSTIPVQKSVTVNITNSSGVHEREPNWSPNGEWIAYISDKTGKDEVWIARASGQSATQITNTADSVSAYRYGLKWSPNSNLLLNSNNARELTIIDILSKTERTIYHSKTYAVRDFAFAPDSKWIAFVCSNKQGYGVIYLYSIALNKLYPITSEFYNSWNPVFSEDGKYLFFGSDRDFEAKINSLEWNFAYLDMAKVYGICLQNDTRSPFLNFIDYNKPPVAIKKLSKKEKEILASADIVIDLEGIENRLFTLPVKVAGYFNLATAKNKLFYVRNLNNISTLFAYNFEKMEETEIGNYRNFAITPDSKHVMFQSDNTFYINKLTEKFNIKEGKLDLSGIKMELNHKAEWQQVFDESWRHFKQFFYAPNMHGINWEAMHAKYSALVPFVTHRTDLSYIIGELIGELNAGHCYVTGGEMPQVKSIGIGLLGADIAFEKETGMYRISNILQGQNWDESLRSPLAEPGLGIKPGCYLIAIDGKQLEQSINPYSYLVGKVNSVIKLTINDIASQENGRDIFIKTIANESELRYYNWVEARRRIVDSVSGGKIGYVHIPDMAVSNGLNWFSKYFYPQARKLGLIVDDRYNGGGNVSPMIIERLRREISMGVAARNAETVYTVPGVAMAGPMVCLINEQSMSDGDMFPFQFKDYGLGPVIGKRSWGGVVGIYGSLPLLDGSSINKPEVAHFGAKSGNWELEGVGMKPDIEVDNHPAKEYEGVDEQLLFAIEKVFELMKTNTKPQVPQVPEYPKK